tara:strand:- start:517 stop:1374 length:858 start_codon:yes stop_codon:yes gene_type:complete
MAQLGKSNQLIIVRETDHGFYLDGGELGEILLPTRETPEGLEQGDEADVFVSRDSEDRIVATSQKPTCEVDDFAALEVTAVHPSVGAFLNWGLGKDLLLPFREQVNKVQEGDVVVIRVLLDKVSNRIVATSRINRYLDQTQHNYDSGDKVSLIVQEKTPLGYMAIIDQEYRGLLQKSQLHRPLRLGESLEGYVGVVRDDYKIDLSLEPVGYGRVTQLTDRILAALKRSNGKIEISDKSSPEEIRRAFGTSKKAFKQAVGALYRKRLIRLDGTTIVLLKEPRKKKG